jgi:hypothetical protein
LDFSKLKLDVYDFLGIILPGLISVAEGWILLRGWRHFVFSISHVSGAGLTLLLIFAFGVGHIAQECGDVVVKWTKGHRYLRRSRDSFWVTEEAKVVRHVIRLELGHEISSVDGAYDYCLTKLKGHFDKRDIFVATSDLCRSLVVLSILGVAPAARVAFCEVGPHFRSLEAFAAMLSVLAIVTVLAWRRMVRFRELSEATVFRAYLGVTKPRDEEA